MNTAVVAKKDDGTVQITFSIPWTKIAKEKEHTIKELASTVEVPGFRKGKAPLDKVEAKLDKQYVLEHTLSHILPGLFADSIKEHKLRPAIYPKFELLEAKENEAWQVRATTAELPKFNLGDYQKVIKKSTKKTEEKSEETREQKENTAIAALVEHYKFTIPQILIDEEINSRLSSLLERIEKLGLSLESYLASVKKTAEELRAEYASSAQRAIRLDIVLGAIAQKETIKVTDEEVNAFIGAARASNQEISDNQKTTVSSFLIKRKVLEKLSSVL